MITPRSTFLFSRPFHGLRLGLPADPSDESLGYFQSSANADSGLAIFCATPRYGHGAGVVAELRAVGAVTGLLKSAELLLVSVQLTVLIIDLASGSRPP